MGRLKSGRLILIILLIPIALFSRGRKEEEPSAIKEPVEEVAHAPENLTLPDAPNAGSYQEIALDSEYALKAVAEAKAVWSGEAKAWETARLLTAESQVVAGNKIRLIYEKLPGFKGAVVFFPLDGGTPTVTWLE